FSHGGDAPARYDLLLRPDLPATERSELHVKHPAPGRRPVLLLFCGLAQRFAMPLNLAHRWLARLGAHVVYPRDFKRVYYLAGVGGLGAGYDATCGALRELATSLDASGIVCLGNSAGSFGALNLALDLHATGVLCLSGPTRIDQSLGDVERGFTDAGLAIASVPRDHLDVRRRLVRMPRRPRHVHGADNDVDRAEAANLAGIGGVELLPIDGWSRHSVVEALIPSGAFDAHLRWLVGTTAPA
ncbi:hypothetical protein K2Z84_09240, partial [Candidatus Binatia bacterium]|nr:hypothetical protein [Candidatus Binatia bacterium]